MTESVLSLRPAAAADREAVLALAPRLAEGVAPWRNHAEAARAGRAWLAESLDEAAAGSAAVLVAVQDGAVIGVLSVRPSQHFTGEHDGYIGELVVADTAARRGIGRALIGAADDWARTAGLTNLTLHTGAYNSRARAFYAALGFTEEEVRLTRPVAPRPDT